MQAVLVWISSREALDPVQPEKVRMPGERNTIRPENGRPDLGRLHMSYNLNAEGTNGVTSPTTVVALPGFPGLFTEGVWNVDARAVAAANAIHAFTSVGIGVYGMTNSDGNAGVRGDNTSGSGNGVEGRGNFSGVAGFGGDVGPEQEGTAGTGVIGIGGVSVDTFVGGGAPGVRGIGGGGPAPSTPISGTATVSGGVGVYGQGGPGAEGGVFQSDEGAQLRLVPSSTPLQDSPLMTTGQVGDLYLFSVAQEVGTTGTYDYMTILWLCIAPALPGSQAMWAQVQLGDTIGG
jgi:hypothetical protein